jgi:hypothetical protein
MGVDLVLEVPIAVANVRHQEVLLVLLLPAANITAPQRIQLGERLWEVYQQTADVPVKSSMARCACKANVLSPSGRNSTAHALLQLPL